jgi:Sulfotransferase family
MIFSREKKLAIFLVPRTGSTSLIKIFREVPNIEVHDEHIKPSSVHLDGYRFFAFYRDPIERFLSGYKQKRNVAMNVENNTNRNILDMSMLDYIRWLKTIDLETMQIYEPQNHWYHKNNEYFNFSDYENNVHHILKEFGVRIDSLPRENRSDETKIDLTDTGMDELKELYSEDYRLLEGINKTIEDNSRVINISKR